MCFTDDTYVFFSQNGFPFFPSSMIFLTHIYDLIYYSSVVKWLRVWGWFVGFGWGFGGFFLLFWLKKNKNKSVIGSLTDLIYLSY